MSNLPILNSHRGARIGLANSSRGFATPREEWPKSQQEWSFVGMFAKKKIVLAGRVWRERGKERAKARAFDIRGFPLRWETMGNDERRKPFTSKAGISLNAIPALGAKGLAANDDDERRLPQRRQRALDALSWADLDLRVGDVALLVDDEVAAHDAHIRLTVI